MSDITNIIVLTSLSEGVERADESDACSTLNLINVWLSENASGQLADVTGFAGGGKYMDAFVLAGAFNGINVEAFVAKLRSLNWVEPEHVQILVKREEDDIFKTMTI